MKTFWTPLTLLLLLRPFERARKINKESSLRDASLSFASTLAVFACVCVCVCVCLSMPNQCH